MKQKGGGAVYANNEQSRVNENGHFGPCAKDHFGWIEDANIIKMSPDGATDDCPDCVNSGIFTLNAYDRPDVIPQNQNTISVLYLF